MNVAVLKKRDIPGDVIVQGVSLLNLKRDEMATIWFALNTQKLQYEQTLIEVLGSGSTNEIEELAFLYTELGRVTRLMYTIKEDRVDDAEYIGWLAI